MKLCYITIYVTLRVLALQASNTVEHGRGMNRVYSWASTVVVLGARVGRRVAFETIKLFYANDINCHPNIAQINMQGASVLVLT